MTDRPDDGGSAALPSGAELWARLDTAKKRRVSEIQAVTRLPSRNPVPAATHGVYGWYRDDEEQAVYVGCTTDGYLRKRLSDHFSKGRDLTGSALRRNVLAALGGPPTTVTAKKKHRKKHRVTEDEAALVNGWLSACRLAWITASSGTAAHAMETAMLQHRKPRLNRK